jgi:hypothetical protein
VLSGRGEISAMRGVPLFEVRHCRPQIFEMIERFVGYFDIMVVIHSDVDKGTCI